MVMGMVATATPATRNGNISITAITTEMMAISISFMNSLMEWLTT